ncbi:FAD-binding domain-containing protein [Multifurca ochricompacta]|uniref:FAD-binding domain-containing protein n=1 Tax=Multifurca ochricompacta TaxID=376703 RepID=A0AAD4QIX7_9AGAM|nr:FAD-binding domain-containing protein [Multifurca ochricompacta]
MLTASFLGCALLLPALLVVTVQGYAHCASEDFDTGYARTQTALSGVDNYLLTCESIAKSVSPASQVFFPGSPEFKADMRHWVNSSSEVSACSVRPGTAQDLGLILRELGATHTPFAVKCSGHTSNPGFSSTRGVHIQMSRFNDITVHEKEGTGLNVVGGRLNGVGVGGFVVGGGYSWKTNQYGLTVDTVTAFELVLPNGNIKKVTEEDKDLFFALKGGLNNYGIVTKYTLKTHNQTDVWGVAMGFSGDQVEPAYTALANFLSKPKDHKGAQLGTIAYNNGTISFGMVLFYDAPKPPCDLYDDLVKLPNAEQSIIEGSFMKFVTSLPNPPPVERSYLDSVPVLHYTAPVLKSIIDEIKAWGDKLKEHDNTVALAFGLDPFEADIFTHGAPSAFPPDRSYTVLPSSLFFGWTDKSLDQFFYDNMRALNSALTEKVIKHGQDVKNAAHYPNYAVYGTTLEQLYGANVKRLREIKKQFDPFRIMDLTGGFKI